MTLRYNSVTLLVCPQAGSGTGGRLAPDVTAGVRALCEGARFEVLESKNSKHLVEVGAQCASELIVMLSGDGSVHDLAQGLAPRPAGNKPTLALIPVGSGNDYARSLGVAPEPLEALRQLPTLLPCAVDVVRATSNDLTGGTADATNTDVANALSNDPADGIADGINRDAADAANSDLAGGVNTAATGSTAYDTTDCTWILNTLSFGIDAAVAVKTEELRQKRGLRGTRLYAQAAIDAILHEFKSHRISIRALDPQPLGACRPLFLQQGSQQEVTANRRLDNGGNAAAPQRLLQAKKDALILAIQNGSTYGSGFKVAPHASLTDGLLDVYCASSINKLQGLYYLLQIKSGKHERLRGFSALRTTRLEISLKENVPVQCDGEQLFGRCFSIEVVPGALTVLADPRTVLADPRTVVTQPGLV